MEDVRNREPSCCCWPRGEWREAEGRGGCYFSMEAILSYTAAAAFVNIAIMIHLTGKCRSALMRKQSMLLQF